jgi:hypothetical protein
MAFVSRLAPGPRGSVLQVVAAPSLKVILGRKMKERIEILDYEKVAGVNCKTVSKFENWRAKDSYLSGQERRF